MWGITGTVGWWTLWCTGGQIWIGGHPELLFSTIICKILTSPWMLMNCALSSPRRYWNDVKRTPLTEIVNAVASAVIDRRNCWPCLTGVPPCLSSTPHVLCTRLFRTMQFSSDRKLKCRGTKFSEENVSWMLRLNLNSNEEKLTFT